MAKKKIKAVPPNPKVRNEVKLSVSPELTSSVAIGLDTSLTSSGYTIFNEDTGELYVVGRVITETVTGYNYDDYRVHYIATEIFKLCQEYNVRVASFEDQYGGVNAKTTIQLVQVRTAIATLLKFHGIECNYDAPTVIKHGLIQVEKLNTIKKEDIADLVVATYPGYLELVGPFSDKTGKKKTSDMYDATSIAMYHCRKKNK